MRSQSQKTIRNFVLIAYIASIAVIVCGASSMASAGSFSYKGYGIRSWPSVKSAELTKESTVTVRHNQTRKYPQDNNGMTVYIRKQEWWGWSVITSKSFVGSTGGSFSRKCSSGTYKLYFEANDPLYTYDIWGSFNW